MLDGFPNNHRFTNEAEAIEGMLAFLKNPKYQRIVICGHVRPDGDCIGSMMGMYHYLKRLGKKEMRLVARNLQMENLLSFLPDGKAPEESYPTDFAADATVVLDMSDPKRVMDGFLEVAHWPMICIDHHATHEPFADLCWVDEHAAATGELLFRLFDADKALTPEIASCLYLALISDTGGFRFGNTSAAVLAAAAKLVEAGAKPAELAGNVWGSVPREMIEISAHVLSHLHFEMDGAFVWAEITQEVYNAHGGEMNDPDNLSGEMRSIKGVQMALLLREGPDGAARGSMRSSGKVDVSKIAATLGGGGHRAASGLEIPGPYAESSLKILEATRVGLAKQL